MPRKIAVVVVIALVAFWVGRISTTEPETTQAEVIGQTHVREVDGASPMSTESAVEQFVCPMHREIVSDEADRCPICGMDLVRRRGESTSPSLSASAHSASSSSAEFPAVTIDPTVVHNLGVRTAIAKIGDMYRSIETMGKITRVDPMARRTLTPPIKGELLSIADKFAGDMIKAGELLFTVSSQELRDLEAEFQAVSLAGDRAAASEMIPHLREMGLVPAQIAALQSGSGPDLPIEVHAFEDGFVYARRGRVGEKVHTGFTVFNVGGNYRVIEVTAEIFERQWGWIAEGQTAHMTLRALPGSVFVGKVVRVEPPVGYTTRSLEVALKFKTDDPGITQSMFAHVSIIGKPKSHVLLVPSDAVIRTGDGQRVVVVRGDGTYQPQRVVAGEEGDGKVVIVSGLEEGAQVVSSGQFLIDSESNLLAGFRRMAPGDVPQEADSGPEHRHGGQPMEASMVSPRDSEYAN